MSGTDGAEAERLDQLDDDYRQRQAVEREYQRLKATEAARERLRAEKAGADPTPLVIVTADQLRATLPPPEAARVAGVLPANGGAVLIAQAGTGKTTLLGNLARDLIDGTPFLGCCDVRQVEGRVALLSFEMDVAELLHWCESAGVDLARLVLIDLRGRRNPLADDADRAALAAQLRALDVDVVLLDTFGRGFTGESQDSASDVVAWFAMLDAFTRAQVGATEWVVTVHAGWNGERARGSSALHDAPDAVLLYTRDADGTRTLSAEKFRGRDPLPAVSVTFDPESLRISAEAASPRHRRYVDAVIAFVRENPGCSQNAIKQGVSGNDAAVLDAIKRARATGEVIATKGRNGWEHTVADDAPEGGASTTLALPGTTGSASTTPAPADPRGGARPYIRHHPSAPPDGADAPCRNCFQPRDDAALLEGDALCTDCRAAEARP